MKANYKPVTISRAKKIIEAEYSKLERQTFQKAAGDIVGQLMAVCLYTLNQNYGFGKTRIQRFKNDVESYFEIMRSGGFFGDGFDADNCIEYIKEKFDIDLSRADVTIKEK